MMMTFDAWANLVVSGKESGDRQHCRLTIETPEDRGKDGRVAIDREVRFTATRSGTASIVFFAEPQGEKQLMELTFDKGATTGLVFALVPDSNNHLNGPD
jgi:hypothetical protein